MEEKNNLNEEIKKSSDKTRRAKRRVGKVLLNTADMADRSQGKCKSFRLKADILCCFVGMCLLHDIENFKNILKFLRLWISDKAARVGRVLLVNLRMFAARNGIDLTEKKNSAKALIAELKNSYRGGFKSFFKHLFKVIVNFLRRFIKCIFGSVNYTAPIMSAILLIVVVTVTLNMTFALEVKYNGESIGYIADESVFETAEKEVLKRIVFEDYIMPDQTVPEFSIKAINEDKLSDEDDITNEIIKASGNELTEGSGLYVNGEFLGALEDGDTLDAILEDVKEPFITGDPSEEVEFVKDVERRDGIYPTSSMVSPAYLENLVTEEQSQQRVYTAVEGDSPILIAQKNGVPYSQLKALNPNIEKELFIGQEILVEKAVPLLEVKLVKTEVYDEDINFKIEQVQDPSQYQGYTKVTRAGKKGVQEVTAKVTYVDGVETGREILSTEVIEEPVNEKIVVGGKRPLQQIPSSSQAHTTSDHFIWPVKGGHVSCLFGNAGYPGHTGLDIAAPWGTPVMASASGTVVRVRYDRWAYGYHIIIDHGGNVQTLYAHNSELYVKVGDWVEQGQVIAAVGRTGNATGNHSHFEVRINGKYMDPANYIGLTCPY